MNTKKRIKAIIGLGNPGEKYYKTRHNIGFRVLDALAEKHMVSWQSKELMEVSEIALDKINIHTTVLLIKPLTFMNSSGKVIPYLLKKGILAEEILVVHDELDKPFGTLSLKCGGSARGHNGLKSIIDLLGPDFWRLRIGIGRPESKEEVPDFVLSPFTQEEQKSIPGIIEDSIQKIELFYLEHLKQ